MPSFDSHMLRWSQGTGKNLAKTKNHVGSFAALRKLLRKPLVSGETRKQFEKMSKDEQDQLKALPGWISGAQFSGSWRRMANLQDRDLLTIDIDYVHDTFPDEMKLGLLKISKWVFLSHSSRRHTPDEPRIRIFMPLSRAVDTDTYIAIVRYVGWLIDPNMKIVDMVSYRPAQMMFLPSCSKDDAKHYFFHDNSEGKGVSILDVDTVLAEIDVQFGDHTDMSRLPRSPDEADYRKVSDKAEDPLSKVGPVGDFCRAYPSIESAMEKFLPGVYIPGDQHSGNPRYTYAGSTSSNGAIIYEDKFLYSFHGHDPVCNMNVNAFDLVRIHLYGKEDEGKTIESPTKAPSYKAMLEMVERDPAYQKSRRQSKFAGVERFTEIEEDTSAQSTEDEELEADTSEDDLDPLAAFDDIEPELSGGRTEDHGDGGADDWDSEIDALVGTPGKKSDKTKKTAKADQRVKRDFPKPPKGWFASEIEVNRNGEIVASQPNINKLCQWDARLTGRIGFNQFTQRPVVVGAIDPKMQGVLKIPCADPVNGDPWEDWMESVLLCILEGQNGTDDNAIGYGMKVGIGDLRMAVEHVARINSFHPIREWLDALEWDGVKRIDTFLQRYLGEADTPYVRDVAWLMLVGACYRAMTPGLKFDHMPIIYGRQGTRKSTFVRVLAGEQWFGELHVELSDERKVAEQIAGLWIGELPEMVSANKTEVNALKQFVRRTKDDCRMAYMKNVTPLPRQAIFIGTTNDKKILRDPTGNRTSLMLEVHVDRIDTVALAAERPQLFAEAMHYLRELRAKTPYGELPLEFRSEEARIEAAARQGLARTLTVQEQLVNEIKDFFDEPRTLRTWLAEMEAEDQLKDRYERFDKKSWDDVLVVPTVFREKDMRRLVLNSRSMTLNVPSAGTVANALESLCDDGWNTTPPDRWRFGTQKSKPMGLRGRWFQRIDATDDERMQGFKVWEPGIDEDDTGQDLI